MTADTVHTRADRRADEGNLRTHCRPATSADLTALIGLLEEIMTHHGVGLPSRADLAGTLTKMLVEAETSVRPRYLFLVAETGGRVVGACSLLFSLSTWSA